MNVWNQFDKRQKVILSIYFIVGLPLLPMVPLMILMKRFLFEDKDCLLPENRKPLVIELLSMQVAMVVWCCLFILPIIMCR